MSAWWRKILSAPCDPFVRFVGLRVVFAARRAALKRGSLKANEAYFTNSDCYSYGWTLVIGWTKLITTLIYKDLLI